MLSLYYFCYYDDMIFI